MRALHVPLDLSAMMTIMAMLGLSKAKKKKKAKASRVSGPMESGRAAPLFLLF